MFTVRCRKNISFDCEYGDLFIAIGDVRSKVEIQELPELNDEFAVVFGVAEGGVDALKVEVKIP